MSDPHMGLLRALLERARGTARFEESRSWDWASATFTGQRHHYRLSMPAGAAPLLTCGLEEEAFVLHGHFLADIWAAPHADGLIEIEALTIEEARPEEQRNEACPQAVLGLHGQR